MRSMRSVGTSPTTRPVTAPFSIATMECGRRRMSCSTTSQSGPSISARPRTTGTSIRMRASSGCVGKRLLHGSSLPSVTGRPALACGPDNGYTPCVLRVSKRVGRLPQRVAGGPSDTTPAQGAAREDQRFPGRSARVTLRSCVLPSRSTVTVIVSPGFLVPRNAMRSSAVLMSVSSALTITSPPTTNC